MKTIFSIVLLLLMLATASAGAAGYTSTADGSSVLTARTFVATTPLSIGNADGVSGNTTYSLTADLSSLGLITVASLIGDIRLGTGLAGSSLGFKAVVPSTAPTNFVFNLTNGVYQTVSLTNNANWLHVTNGSGAGTIVMRPGGADRLITCPTNWIALFTNGLVKSGGLWSMTLTNGINVALLSVLNDGNAYTNTIFSLTQNPLGQ